MAFSCHPHPRSYPAWKLQLPRSREPVLAPAASCPTGEESSALHRRENVRTCRLGCLMVPLPLHYSSLKPQPSDCTSSAVRRQPGWLKAASAGGKRLLTMHRCDAPKMPLILECWCISPYAAWSETLCSWRISSATVFGCFFICKRFSALFGQLDVGEFVYQK